MLFIFKRFLLYNALGKVEDIQANSYHDEALKKVSAELNVVAYASDALLKEPRSRARRLF